MDDYKRVPLKIVATLKALPEAEFEALRKDAERYRWLAGNGWAEPALYATGPRGWGANGVALLAGPQLDDAIDGAMDEQQKSALQRLADDAQAMGLTY